METKATKHKNASGDIFVVRKVNDGWRATQLTGTERNYLNIPAGLYSSSKSDLLKQLKNHFSN